MNETKLRKRNFLALMLEGTFFFTGLAFLDANAIIPVFIYTFTQSLQLAGLATTINMASSILTQTLVGPYIKRIINVPAFIIKIMFIFRPLPLLMIPVLFGHFNPFVTVSLFLIIYAMLWGSDGWIVLPWSDLFARTVAPEKRGKLLGYQQLLGGIGSLAAGFIIKSTLENPGYSNEVRYSIIFGCAATLLIISSIAMLFARDLPRKPSIEKVNHVHYYRQLPFYLRKNKAFARMAIVRILASVTGMISPFLILFGKGLFQLNGSQISTLIYVQIIGGLVGGIVWGNISSRMGNKFVIMISQIIGLILPILALGCLLLKGFSLPYFILWPIAFANGLNMGSWLGFMNYTMDVVNEEERTIYLLLNSLITFPLTLLSYFAGILADQWGFIPLFAISGTSAIIAIYLSRRLKSPQQMLE